MNMCMIEDKEGRVLALDKINDTYKGTTFPGGHVEPNETFTGSIIREVSEETGITILNPKLCGIYHWIRDGVHFIVYIYKAIKFKGKLTSSSEGQVYWISLDDFLKKDLAPGMEAVVKLIQDDELHECFMEIDGDGLVERLM